MTLLDVKTLDDLAAYFGYPSYEKLKGLVYPHPMYTMFKLPKKTGGFREISAPAARLKEHQRKLADDIKVAFGNRSHVAHAFIEKRSIVTNALPHVGKASVVRIDLSDFFGQITFGRVKGVFKAAPFNFADDVATVLAQLCSHNGKLPQGAPTSASLSNFVCLSLDRKLSTLARRYKGRYTRYADDLTFSFKHLTLAKLSKQIIVTETDASGRIIVRAGPLLEETISNEGFNINPVKTRGADRTARQLITGLLANHQLVPPRKYIDKLRRAFFIWSKHGLAAAELNCVPILHSRKYASGAAPSFLPLVQGKLNFLSMVTGKSGTTYQRLALQYNSLVVRDEADPVLRKKWVVKIDPKVQNIQDAIKATWYLQNGNCFEGTAFRFKGNIWVTCAHCVGDLVTKELYPDILLSSGDWAIKDLSVRVAAVDWDRDLAILRPQPLVPVPRYLAYFDAAANAPLQDARVGVIGFPGARLNQPPIFMRARVLRVRTKKGVSRIEIDKHIQKGNSGGPLFDENYRVLGVVAEGAVVIMDGNEYEQGENACVSITELSHLKA